jgi:D-alanyl-lipoteichoic acid acyltransferase DltB (MBOAT superfamily)
VSAAAPAVAIAPGIGALMRHWLTLVQLALAVLVVYLFDIEGDTFSKVMTLTAGGFAVQLVLPMAWRLPWFVALSLAGILWVFGLADGLWFLGLGGVLIAACHLPFTMRVRVAIVAVLALGFAALRAGYAATPWTGAIWPILGSMFMFRLALYLRALKSAPAERGLLGTLAYFFMLPNVAFPLFPVIDYQTFHRTSFDRDETSIYTTGMQWIARGLLHLVLYRLVYYNFLGDPIDVEKLGDLVQYMLGTFLLYLRVSGQFHLIVGLLYLFGFRLPETHKLYYLAHNFTELWRRINIYWTDFMMKTVFYPTYFKVKKLKPATALAISTAAVFVVTWLLHSYQWFWLRGGFPMTWPDGLFWGILGACVIVGALRELKQGKAKARKAGEWSLRLGLRAAITFCLFCFLWSLWSAESVGQWILMLGAFSEFDLRGLILLGLTFLIVMLLGGRDWEAASRTATQGWQGWIARPAVRTGLTLAVLLAISQPAVRALTPSRVGEVLASLQTTGLNARDAALKHRGYYEQLDVRGQINARTQDEMGGERRDWSSPASVGILRERRDLVDRDLVPSYSVLWNDMQFSTNSHGMRDREYALEKPAGTFRIALLGPSHVMGNGVADGQTFEQLVEDRLNRELGTATRRFEILNFGIDGFTLPQQQALLQERVFQFSPDLVIMTTYENGRVMTERYVLKILGKGVEVPAGSLHDLLVEARLLPVSNSGIPVPFESARRLAGALGIEARMPADEAAVRIHRIVNRINDDAIRNIAALSREHGARVVALALNAVVDEVEPEVPNHDAFVSSNVPVMNLFDVYPASQRAALRVTPWDDHPNAAGHRLIADRLHRELTPYLMPE